MYLKFFYLAFLLLNLTSPLHAEESTDQRTYPVNKNQAYEAVLGALGQLGMPIESSNPTGGYVKSSTAYRSGLFMKLDITNVFVQPVTDNSSLIRIERLTGKAGKAPKPDPDPSLYDRLFSAIDREIASRFQKSN